MDREPNRTPILAKDLVSSTSPATGTAGILLASFSIHDQAARRQDAGAPSPGKRAARPSLRSCPSSPSPLNGERAVRGENAPGLPGAPLRAGLPILLLLLFTISAISAPQLAWEARHNFGLPTNNHQVVAMTLDSSGDIVIAGNKISPSGDFDYAILKYSQTGTQLWANTYSSGPQTNDRLRAMTVDSNGNVYVTGTSTTVKYNRDGLLQWVAPYAGRALAADSNEFVYVVGFQTNDFATVKLAPEGTNVWLRTYDRPFGRDVAQAVALGPAGEVYVGGTVTWAYDRFGYYVKFALVKYDAEGNQLWVSPDFAPPGGLHGFEPNYEGGVRRIIPLGDDRVYLGGNLVGGSSGNYVTGLFDSEVGTNEWYFADPSTDEGMTSMVLAGSGEIYMTGWIRSAFPATVFCRTIALNTNGALRWQADLRQAGMYHRGNSIALDVIASVYVAGQRPSTDPDQNPDFLTIKYDNDGRELWTKRYNGPANGSDIAITIAVTPDGAIFVAGQSANTNGGTDFTLLKYVDLVNIQWLSEDAVLLQFPAAAGQSVRFQASTNLTKWQDLATVTVPSDNIARYTDTTVSQHPHRFYRLALP